MRMAKTKISLCAHAVWSGLSLSTKGISGYYRRYGEQRPGWYFALAPRWSKSVHFAHVQKHFSAWSFLWSFFNIIYTFLGSIFEPCYIRNCVITNRVIKRLKCIRLFSGCFLVRRGQFVFGIHKKISVSCVTLNGSNPYMLTSSEEE